MIAMMLGAACNRPGESAQTQGLASQQKDALNVARYDVVGAYDWSRRLLDASVTVTLDPSAGVPSSVVLDSQVTAIKAVTMAGDGRPLRYAVDDTAHTLTVQLGDATKTDGGIAFKIDYEAAPNYSQWVRQSISPLESVDAERGDPVLGRTVYTMSEPIGARTWLPSHDTPSDRALFSIDLQVERDEAVIANAHPPAPEEPNDAVAVSQERASSEGQPSAFGGRRLGAGRVSGAGGLLHQRRDEHPAALTLGKMRFRVATGLSG
jgi:aminopeptidase N